MFCRIRDFKEQKLIPREELPEEYHPHRSFYGKLANWSAGIDPRKPNQIIQLKSEGDMEMPHVQDG
jgi:hypothetical protein